MNSVELFAGAGGLALGVSKAGFQHLQVLEWDDDSCNTIRFNKFRNIEHVKDWPLYHGDVRGFDFCKYEDKVDLVSGGPPCQPFSLGGKHRGHRDHRDMFPEAVRAVREMRPCAFMFENVKGLLRESFSRYFEYVLRQLEYPEICIKKGETWESHLQRLERYHTGGAQSGLCYRVVFSLVNAADYGIPQRRERVILVGFRNDLNVQWCFPQKTHSREALLWSKWISEEYWERHRIPRRARPERPADIDVKIDGFVAPVEKPWVTVRDAISDLPDPVTNRRNRMMNHVYQPGARVYMGHTGSPMDEPGKTLKAGDHGVPGGENMVVLADGSTRYFTVRESARLQTFPDDYGFAVSWTESMRQLGNAVPAELSHLVASDIHKHLARLEN